MENDNLSGDPQIRKAVVRRLKTKKKRKKNHIAENAARTNLRQSINLGLFQIILHIFRYLPRRWWIVQEDNIDMQKPVTNDARVYVYVRM